ncbi:hypothetical protein [Kitasatospora sp. NPDC002040]|uniref:hypothetical protein n=1 Tax=Kitasatospora sp. NPDC002040 TaxID=3154661 RepID=UPI00331ED818
MQEPLWQDHRINWNDQPDGVKRGRLTARREEDVTIADAAELVKLAAAEGWPPLVRHRWATGGAPHFTTAPGGPLDELIPKLGAL